MNFDNTDDSVAGLHPKITDNVRKLLSVAKPNTFQSALNSTVRNIHTKTLKPDIDDHGGLTEPGLQRLNDKIKDHAADLVYQIPSPNTSNENEEDRLNRAKAQATAVIAYIIKQKVWDDYKDIIPVGSNGFFPDNTSHQKHTDRMAKAKDMLQDILQAEMSPNTIGEILSSPTETITIPSDHSSRIPSEVRDPTREKDNQNTEFALRSNRSAEELKESVAKAAAQKVAADVEAKLEQDREEINTARVDLEAEKAKLEEQQAQAAQTSQAPPEVPTMPSVNFFNVPFGTVPPEHFVDVERPTAFIPQPETTAKMGARLREELGAGDVDAERAKTREKQMRDLDAQMAREEKLRGKRKADGPEEQAGGLEGSTTAGPSNVADESADDPPKRPKTTGEIKTPALNEEAMPQAPPPPPDKPDVTMKDHPKAAPPKEPAVEHKPVAKDGNIIYVNSDPNSGGSSRLLEILLENQQKQLNMLLMASQDKRQQPPIPSHERHKDKGMLAESTAHDKSHEKLEKLLKLFTDKTPDEMKKILKTKKRKASKPKPKKRVVGKNAAPKKKSKKT